MVNQLLDLAKVESNSMKINWVQSDIQGFISSIASDHLELADQKNITIHTVLQPQSLYMDYDPDMLQKIVSNLIANSIKYGNENNIIIIESIKSEEQLELNIKDNGPGIDPVDQSSLFSRFFRGRHHQSSSITGFGIGLSLCKELSEILGGNITHHDNDLGGSTFSVHLPIHTDKAKVQVLSTEKSRDESIPSANPERLVFHENGKNILIVEDNSELIDLLSSILNPLYNLTTAKNGKEGLKYAKSQVPDLIISDVMMPEMDGIQMTKHLKTDILTSHIPVIMLTAKASHESKIEGLQTGANAYLTKPFSEEELLLKVKNGLNFVDALRTRFTETVAENTLVDPFIQRAIEIVEANIEKEVFNAQYLCGELNLSRSQVYRKLKALTGQNIQKFILDVRLRKSLSFLNDLSLTISEIAFKCGFNDPSHFSNAFFAYKGERPKDYRSRKA